MSKYLSTLKSSEIVKLPEDKEWFFNRNNLIQIKNKENAEKYESCSICLSEFVPGEYITGLYCKHNFHVSCIQKWIKMNEKCPLCKHDFRKHKDYAKWDA